MGPTYNPHVTYGQHKPYGAALTPPAPQPDPVVFVDAIRALLARKGPITRAQVAAAFTTAHIPL